MADGKGIASFMENRDVPKKQRSVNRVAAAILSRVICPEKANWPAKAARDLLRLRFADEDLDRFHLLLARHYGDTSTTTEEDELERYLFVNCLLTMMHERARQSLTPANASGSRP